MSRSATQVVEPVLQIRNPAHMPTNSKLLPKPSMPKPSKLEQKLKVAEDNFQYCVEKQDIQRALHWANQRTELRKMFEQVRNGEQQLKHDDSSQYSQEPQTGGRCQEDPCGRHEGPGVARDGEAHIRRPEEVRPDEDQEGPHRQQEEACARQEVPEEPQEGGLRRQEGDV
jgi:hypothetical protein